MKQSPSEPRANLFKAASRNLLISAAGSVLSYLSFVLVAYMFGATAQTDVFMFASSFVLVVAALITTVFGAIFLPLYIKLLHGADGSQRAALFANAMLYRLLLLALLGGGLIFFFPVPLFSFVSRLGAAALADSEHILVYFSLIFGLTILNEYLRVLLQAREAFVPASLSSVLQPAANVACVWLLAGSLGYESLVVAAAGSRLLQFGFLVWHVRALGLGLRSWPVVLHNPDVAEFVRVARPFWLASIISMGSVFFYDYVASGLPVGNMTAVAYAQKIYQLPISLLALPVIEVLHTRMAMLYAKRDMQALAALYALSIKSAVLAMLPISLLMAFNAQEVTSILLSRGAYSAQSQAITANSLQVFALAIPLIVLFSINGRVPLVLQRTRMSSFFGSIGQLATIGVVWFMAKAFGYMGLSGAKLLVEWVLFFPFGFFVAQRYLPEVDFRPIVRETAKIVFAALLALGLLYGLQFTPLGATSPLLFMVCASGGYLLIYYFACRALRLDVLQALRSALGFPAKHLA